jgi:hypothetical protein
MIFERCEDFSTCPAKWPPALLKTLIADWHAEANWDENEKSQDSAWLFNGVSILILSDYFFAS